MEMEFFSIDFQFVMGKGAPKTGIMFIKSRF